MVGCKVWHKNTVTFRGANEREKNENKNGYQTPLIHDALQRRT